MESLVVDFDDFGVNHVISGMCQSRDCRAKLDELHLANPNFKVTLFTIPGEMTAELGNWCHANRGWVELGVHGFFHTSNYECEKMSYDEFDAKMKDVEEHFGGLFAKLFKAPGWQISDDAFRWLNEHDWIVADQSYNNDRRPADLVTYINDNGRFGFFNENEEFVLVNAWHGHTWDCCGNGIYETFDDLMNKVRNTQDFKFVTEVING